jgi:hypothetical protein
MFSIYFRGEFQHAPSWEGYSLPLSETLATIDDFATFSSVPLPGNTTIPLGPVSSVNNLTVLEGYVSAHVVGHEISFGKMDNWYGPGRGRWHGLEQQCGKRMGAFASTASSRFIFRTSPASRG